jgi:hypothetical protein
LVPFLSFLFSQLFSNPSSLAVFVMIHALQFLLESSDHKNKKSLPTLSRASREQNFVSKMTFSGRFVV